MNEEAPPDLAARLLAAQAASTVVRVSYGFLRDLVNDPNVSGVSWEKLGAELEWSVPASLADDGNHIELDAPTNLEDAARRYRLAIEKGASQEEALRTFVPLVLGLETKGIIVRYDGKDGEPGTVVFPPSKEAEVEEETARHGKKAAKKLVADWVRPFVVGAPPPGFTIANPLTGEREPPRGIVQAPLEGEIRGSRYRAYPFATWSPLEVYRETRRALFPITVQILFEGSEHLSWTAEERELFWSQFFAWGFDSSEFPPIAETTEALFAYLRERERTSSPDLVVQRTEVPERLMLEAPTRVDHEAVRTFATLYGQRLPRSWSRVRKIEDLERERVEEILASYGEDEATRDFRAELDDRDARGPMLEREWRGTTSALVLSDDEKAALRRDAGRRGFREVREDRDGILREYLVKSIQGRDGSASEVGLSWYGTVERLIEDARRESKRKLREQLNNQQEDLFSSLEGAEKEDLDRKLSHIGALDDAAEVWTFLARTFGAIGENPVRVEAFELYEVLRCSTADNRLARVQGALRALQELRFMATARGRYVDSAFVTRVEYVPRGGGRHSDGIFFVRLSSESIGVLAVFNDTRIQRGGRTFKIFRFNRTLSKGQRKQLGEGDGPSYLKGFRLTPLHARARDLSREERALLNWIESQITTNRANTRKGRDSFQIRKGPSASEPRIYSRDFCPLLREGVRYFGALGNYQNTGTAKAAEAGRRLIGRATTSSREGRSGAREAGLLYEMGFELPKGAEKRAETLRSALNAMRRVVEVEAGGVVAIEVPHHDGNRWYGLEDAVRDLDVGDLLQEAKYLFFLPEDWRAHLARGTEEILAKTAEKTGYQIRITEDRALAERDAEAREKGVRRESSSDATETPLHEKLRARLAKERLTTAKAGELLGVSAMTVSNWTSGRKRIPDDRVPLLRRWLDGGAPPSAEELLRLETARPSRRGGRREPSESQG